MKVANYLLLLNENPGDIYLSEWQKEAGLSEITSPVWTA
jgi:hypothetical protein